MGVQGQSARSSLSIYKSDINSDYVVNNAAYGVYDDLEQVNIV